MEQYLDEEMQRRDVDINDFDEWVVSAPFRHVIILASHFGTLHTKDFSSL